MEKLNIAELLRDCPKGMELDCTICDNVYFDEVTQYLIKCFVKNDTCNTIYFHHNGAYLSNQNAKCVIFPKGKTTWEGFQRPFKDGDIIYIRDEYSDATFTYVAILKQIKGEQIYSYCFYDYQSDKLITDDYLYDGYNIRFATEEEKQKLFDAIKANGYKWNPETKTLEKLDKPRFKVGERVKHKKGYFSGVITEINGEYFRIEYDRDAEGTVDIRYQDDYELVPNKFDITTLKPFESRVLVRDCKSGKWYPAIWGLKTDDIDYPYIVTGGEPYNFCIPYENNQHLLGTTNDCDEYYKTW